MKKLLVAIVVVTMARVLNAASVTWTLAAVQKPDGSGAAANYLAMVFSGDSSQSSVISAIMARNSSGLVALANDWNQTTQTTSAGLLRSSGNGNYSAGEAFSAFIVIFDASTVLDANHFFVSQTKSGKIAANGANATLAFGTYAQNVTAGSAWQAIPEPTSGLMILLGMAGLALRRKQA